MTEPGCSLLRGITILLVASVGERAAYREKPHLSSQSCGSKAKKTSYSPSAFQSLLDDQGLAEVSKAAEKVLDAVNQGLYKEATELWGQAEMVIEQV